jgi:hypothetical protein
MVRKILFIRSLFLAAFLFLSVYNTMGQKKQLPRDDNNSTNQPANEPGKQTTGKSKDSSGIKHRDKYADSITISYRYLDSLKVNRLDSSLNDFNKYFSVPANYVTLGNNGSAAYPVLFTPILKAGWDAGFHAYDVYKFTLEQTKFYRATRPYSQITYLLGSGKEQLVDILHTQNVKSNWNFGFNYRLISAPGFFKTQNTNHNSYRIFSNYQGKRKRYAAWLVLVGNKLNASENGGIVNDSLLTNVYYKRRFTIPVSLGGDAAYGQNIFSTKVSTGNLYKDFTFFLRQSYDFGKRDSIQVNDSTKEFLFYPKLRFSHTLTLNTYTYRFKDTLTGLTDARADSAIFQQWYDTTLKINTGLNFLVQDNWKSVTNDFSIRQFPETKNPAQFIEAGVRLENYTGTFSSGTIKFYNLVAHFEYRNKTRNKKWDAEAKGELYANGYYAGDYNAYISLTRNLNKKLGDVRILFQDINRSPSFIFNNESSFNFHNNLQPKKENIIILSAAAENPKFTLWVRNIAITNYTYFKDYYHTDQSSSLINILQAQGYKKFRITKHFNLYSDALLQQATANAPISVPLFYTRQRLAFEGNFFKNLDLSTGLDVSYNTPYKTNNYSPVMGQFFPQDSVTISNTPNVAVYFDFRIKSFRGLVKVENLNTVNFADGFSFTKNNFAAPHYPTPGFIFRIGVSWGFVN